ncbi:unnamed protein product [Protopolystoma xenopodis]|uniref:Ionotropic glutamate receptor C-terminal domain-containing protein n=1 Tax=Protopolystoma xenopodis TaxID=117903 RepID=A0A448X736_9PLAT|nr:unnamed protein product [Protopolystoma xenopodis]
MNKYMESEEGVLMNSTESGIERVKKGDYAFILESTLNEYYTQRNCDLVRLGGFWDPRGYGIGLPIGSKFITDIFGQICF